MSDLRPEPHSASGRACAAEGVFAKSSPDSFSIEEHNHRFAAWAAGRAASTKKSRFSVATARQALEACGLNAQALKAPSALPKPEEFDAEHKNWRARLCAHFDSAHQPISHGTAAKLINVYLKARFVCPPYAFHSKVAALHPPVDRLLLDELAENNFGKKGDLWRRRRAQGWSNMQDTDYENVIADIRAGLGKQPLWKIEFFWKGHQ